MKQETIDHEPDSIRAQFFADLKRSEPNIANLASSPSSETSSSQHSVTLKSRDESEDSLPPRKRKVDMNGGEETSSDCKKTVLDEDLDKSIKLETTSC